jgi:hypothetical protein
VTIRADADRPTWKPYLQYLERYGKDKRMTDHLNIDQIRGRLLADKEGWPADHEQRLAQLEAEVKTLT